MLTYDTSLQSWREAPFTLEIFVFSRQYPLLIAIALLKYIYISLVASKYFGAIALKLSLLREWPISHYIYIIQKTTMPKSCAIYQCSATSENEKNLSFHQFPTDPKLRRAILVLRHMYVPFISLKRISTRATSA